MEKARHEVVFDTLKKEILERRFEPGDKLPSEQRLCSYFKVSRVTVRHALSNLESQGFIYRKQGLGAFVKDQSIETGLVQLTDFSEEMRKSGLKSSSKLLSMKKVPAEREINEILDISLDAPLIKLERVRIAGDLPIALDITWLPATYGQLLFDENLEEQTIYQIFEEKYSIPIIAGRYKITATSATAFIAEHLEMQKGDALLEIDRCSKTTGGKKVYFQKRYNNPNYISYELELSRAEDSNISTKNGLPLKEFVPKFYS